MASPASPTASDSPSFAPLGDWLSGWIGGGGSDGGASAGGGNEAAHDGESCCGLPPASDAFWRRDAAAVAADALALTRLYDAPREAELQRLRAAAAQSQAVLSTAAAAVEQRRALLAEVRPSRCSGRRSPQPARRAHWRPRYGAWLAASAALGLAMERTVLRRPYALRRAAAARSRALRRRSAAASAARARPNAPRCGSGG